MGKGTPRPTKQSILNTELDIDVQKGKARRKAMELLKLRDSNFSEPPFLSRVKMAFRMIQEAWSIQDLNTVQAFLSDAVYERFSLQIDDLRSDRIKDVMEDISILDSRIVKVDSDSHFDTMHVFVKAEAVNYRADLDSGEFLDGSKEPQEFSEVWSFVRSLNSMTSEKSGLIEGCCPNCSAPIEISRTAICKACNSFLRSGEYDWVLSEITQTCEWTVNELGEIPGLKAIQSSDPGFNVQHIEDRASLIFWRGMDCYRKGKVEPLLKCSSSAYLAEFSKNLASDSSRKRNSYANPAVGSVEVLLVSPEEPMDQVFVEIRWSGEPIKLDSSGKKISGTDYPKNSHDLFVLKRKHSAQTDTRLSFSSANCPDCGAPETNATDNVCPYCNTAFNDGSREWIIDRVMDTNDQEFLTLRKAVMKSSENSVLNPGDHGKKPVYAQLPGLIRSPADAIRWMAAMMIADGVVSPSELEALQEFAKKQKIPAEKLDEILKAAEAGEALPELPKDLDQIRTMVKQLISMALVDGKVSPEEFQMLRSAGKNAEISDYEINQMIAQEKKRLHS
ncbi:MAG: TIM44-like domain-containing protein [Candidatus Riflebacteria bacterium]|nr:TIM44-like domain-containing protein [Candidatus Riflebacteria bacterium]